eukprot:GEMP01020918.1.p1 GENE.GEMP01020918.1~~GEMP01020918.1.p1  ORF type:complete len:826 (+),score=214.73 GEMP01020918.1:32-2479(+)
MERQWSLPHLQNLIKRDPEAYEGEFTTQLLHFESTLEVFHMKPQKPAKHFNEQVMFLAHVTPCYPEKQLNFHGKIISILKEHCRVLHPLTRRTLVSALILLRIRNVFPLLEVIPLYFQLFTLDDKVLRATLFAHIVRDIMQTNQKSKNQQWNREVQAYFFKQMKSEDLSVVRKAAAIVIALYKKRIWTDQRCVNMISTLCLCKDSRVGAAAIRFMLGQSADLEEEIQSEDEKVCEEATKVAKEVAGPKKNKASLRKLKRVKKSAKRLLEKRGKKKSSYEAVVNFAALDVLHDPQSLVERLLQRVMKQGDKFKFRLLALQLISRLVGRHELMLLNLYSYLLKYLTPHQRDVTHILACLAMACHPLVPPEEISPVISHLINAFINETCSKEVIAVGLNALREICFRQPLALMEDQLSDLAEFRKFKDKGVVVAAKSLLNLYREVNPAMLHRSLRGKEASMALARGELDAPEYAKEIKGAIDGLELFANKMLKPRRGSTASDSDAELSGLSDMDAIDSDSEEELDSDSEEAEDADEENLESAENVGTLKTAENAENREKVENVENLKNVENQETAESAEKPENVENQETAESAEKPENVENQETAESAEKPENVENQENVENRENVENPKNPKTLENGNASATTQAEKARTLARNLATETVFGSKDFAKMRKLSLKQSLTWQLGKKRAREAAISSDESSAENGESDDESESESEQEEVNEPGWDVVNPDDLKTSKSRRKGKAARLESILKGREDRPAFGKATKERSGGSTNKEKRRNKPMLMSRIKSKRKVLDKATNKLRNARKHIKELKRKTNKRRR